MKRLFYNSVRLTVRHRGYQFTRIVLIILFVAACSSGDGDPDPDIDLEPVTLTFAEVVATGGNVQDTTTLIKSKTQLGIDTLSVENYDIKDPAGNGVKERQVCVTKTYDVMDGNSKFPLFSSVGEQVIYPGGLLQGKTLNDEIPKPIVVKRAGGAISYNLINGNKSARVEVDEVTGSKIQQAMNSIIGGGEEVPDNFHLEISQVESESELAFNLGISYENFTTSVKADMSFSTDRTYNRMLVKLTQQFYTMRFDLPTSLDEIFDKSVTPQDLAKYVQTDNPATFISSVSYGRIFYMLIESTSSRTEMKASINGGYSGVVQQVDVNAEIASMESLKDKKITVIAYGGDDSSGLAGLSSIEQITDRLNSSKDINFGLPLSYVVRSVDRPDDVVGTQLATTASEVECTTKGYYPPTNYLELVDLFEDGIGAAVNLYGTKLLLYNMAGDKYALYDASIGKKGKYIYDFDKGPFGLPVEFGPVGAAVLFRKGQLHFFDKEGLNFIRMYSVTPTFEGDIVQFEFLDCNCRIGDRPVSNPYQTSNFYSINAPTTAFPFANDGIGAVGLLTGIEVEGAPSLSFNYAWYFSNDGSETALLGYNYQTGFTWEAKQSTKSLFGDDPSFEKVGAGAYVEFSAASLSHLYFNEEGDQMIIGKGIGNEAVYTGPYVVN